MSWGWFVYIYIYLTVPSLFEQTSTPNTGDVCKFLISLMNLEKKKIVKSNLKISKPFKIAINKINNKIKYYLSHMTHSLGWDQIFLVQQAHLEDTIFANHLNFSGFSNSVIGSTQSLDTSANTSE